MRLDAHRSTPSLEAELFSDVEILDAYVWPSLDHLIEPVSKPRRVSEKGVVYRGMSYFGELESYLSAP